MNEHATCPLNASENVLTAPMSVIISRNGLFALQLGSNERGCTWGLTYLFHLRLLRVLREMLLLLLLLCVRPRGRGGGRGALMS